MARDRPEVQQQCESLWTLLSMPFCNSLLIKFNHFLFSFQSIYQILIMTQCSVPSVTPKHVWTPCKLMVLGQATWHRSLHVGSCFIHVLYCSCSLCVACHFSLIFHNTLFYINNQAFSVKVIPLSLLHVSMHVCSPSVRSWWLPRRREACYFWDRQ